MGNILSILVQIFTGKEDESFRVGISEFKQAPEIVEKRVKITKKISPQQLRLSELMRKSSC